MFFNNSPADCEPQPSAFVLCADVRLEDTINALRVKAWPVILYRNCDGTGFTVLFRSDGDHALTTGQCVLGINHQIIQDLAKAVGINRDTLKAGVRFRS